MLRWWSLLDEYFDPSLTEQKLDQLHLGFLALRLPTFSLSQVFSIAVLLVSRIQVSQKFKEAMDCFGHLPNLLLGGICLISEYVI